MPRWRDFHQRGIVTPPTKKALQRHLDELVGDHVLFTVHDGDPGLHGTNNLAFGTGLPQPYSFTQGGSVGFLIPPMRLERVRVPLQRRWWQIRKRYRIREVSPMVRIQAVMMWSNGRCVMPINLPEPEYLLRSGDMLTVIPNGKPKVMG